VDNHASRARPEDEGGRDLEASEVEGNTVIQSEVLEDLAGARNYRRWLVDLALPHLGNNPLEVGGGLGDYVAEWMIAGVPRFTTSEADPKRLQALRRRFEDALEVQVRELTVPIDELADYSAVVAFNVLEHVPDDVAALRAFAGLVRTNGRVVIIVPAFPSAMSAFDLAIGHQRRYRRATLRTAAERAGLSVEELHYVNSAGLLAWYILIKALRGRPKAGLLLTVYDRAVVPWLRWSEDRMRPPFGQSLFLVGRRL
jgi:SAM-dependent methyltransferase